MCWPRSRRRCAASQRWWHAACRRRRCSGRSPTRSGGCFRSNTRTWAATSPTVRDDPAPRLQSHRLQPPRRALAGTHVVGARTRGRLAPGSRLPPQRGAQRRLRRTEGAETRPTSCSRPNRTTSTSSPTRRSTCRRSLRTLPRSPLVRGKRPVKRCVAIWPGVSCRGGRGGTGWFGQLRRGLSGRSLLMELRSEPMTPG